MKKKHRYALKDSKIKALLISAKDNFLIKYNKAFRKLKKGSKTGNVIGEKIHRSIK